jgi:hypothetical protein
LSIAPTQGAMLIKEIEIAPRSGTFVIKEIEIAPRSQACDVKARLETRF